MAEEKDVFGGKTKRAIVRLWYAVVDTLFPRPRTLLSFEMLSLSELRALARPRAIGSLCTSLFNYKDARIRSAIWEMKYRGNRSVARRFALLLFEELVGEASDASEFSSRHTPIIVPIPIAPSRRRERGFNQTELLLEEILACDTTHVLENGSGLLVKSRETRTQTRLGTRYERVQNMRGSFGVKDPNRARGRFIILIDDVVTTGSTLVEARTALLAAGAERVAAFAIAH